MGSKWILLVQLMVVMNSKINAEEVHLRQFDEHNCPIMYDKKHEVFSGEIDSSRIIDGADDGRIDGAGILEVLGDFRGKDLAAVRGCRGYCRNKCFKGEKQKGKCTPFDNCKCCIEKDDSSSSESDESNDSSE